MLCPLVSSVFFSNDDNLKMIPFQSCLNSQKFSIKVKKQDGDFIKTIQFWRQVEGSITLTFNFTTILQPFELASI
jgi:hypothetical protein